MAVLKRVLCITLALVLCFVAVFQIGSGIAEADSEFEELQKERLDLQKEYYDLLDDIENIQDVSQRLKKQASSLNKRIELLRGMIEILSQEHAIVSKLLAEKEDELNNKQKQLADTRELLIKRLRAMYMSTDSSSLSALLAADSFYEFLVSAEYMARISANDQRLMTRYRDEKLVIEEAKAVIDEEKRLLEESLAEQVALNIELDAALAEVEDNLENQKLLEQEMNESLEVITAALEANEEEIAAYCAESNGEFIGGIWVWPVPGYKTITSPYGYRIHPITKKYALHTGCDISGYRISGKPVVAAGNGTVTLVRYYTTGYGYYVMIDHGGGVYSLYAHLSSIKVSTGDVLLSGQQLGTVGSTGNSTGPHLHFEIRINGKTQDPLDLAFLGGLR